MAAKSPHLLRLEAHNDPIWGLRRWATVGTRRRRHAASSIGALTCTSLNIGPQNIPNTTATLSSPSSEPR
jgi:hypothetical protein